MKHSGGMSKMYSNHYRALARATAYYERFGFRYVETDWVVQKEIAMITAPNEECLTPFSDNVFLVGSGEQSLLAMIERGELAPGKYQTTTPCFRNEPVLDELHQKYFLKNELMIFEPEDADVSLRWLVEVCVGYVSRIAKGSQVAVVDSEKPFEKDIAVNGIEVGSYGIRTYRGYTWVYGTGHAEPRMSIAQKSKQ